MATSGINALLGETLLPSGISGSLWNDISSPHGALVISAEHDMGISAPYLISFDILKAGAIPDGSVDIVLGYGLKFYFDNQDGFVGIGLARGIGFTKFTAWISKTLGFPGKVPVGSMGISTPIIEPITW
jgi:hypothetical protein